MYMCRSHDQHICSRCGACCSLALDNAGMLNECIPSLPSPDTPRYITTSKPLCATSGHPLLQPTSVSSSTHPAHRTLSPHTVLKHCLVLAADFLRTLLLYHRHVQLPPKVAECAHRVQNSRLRGHRKQAHQRCGCVQTRRRRLKYTLVHHLLINHSRLVTCVPCGVLVFIQCIGINVPVQPLWCHYLV